jgi:hypothetical protein
MAMDPCDMSEGDDEDGGGGGRGGRGGGGGNAGPTVAPGIYQVALVVDGDVVDSKSLTIVMDPEVALGSTERIAYNNITNDLHELQRRGTAMASRLNDLHEQVTGASEQIEGSDDVDATVKSDFEVFEEAWDELRAKFGVPRAAGGGGRGRGGGGGNSANVLARAGALKGSILAFWEAPSEALVGQYYEVKPALEAAIAEAEAMLERARDVSEMLDDEGIEMEVPEGEA